MLYPDQAELVGRVRNAMRQNKAVLMQSATGSGKTRMALDMIAGAHSKGNSCIFTVPRKELLAQTIETIEGYGIPYGVISPDYTPNPFATVQVAMVQTLSRRLHRTPPPRVLFVDEAHYGGAELDRVIDWSRAGGGWRVGLSATPMKTNGKAMADHYDHMEKGLPVADLIQMKRLSDFRYFAPHSPDLSAVKVSNGEYVQSQLASFMEADRAIIGDAVKTYRDLALGRLNIVFATSRKHGGIIADTFKAAGITAMMIDGTMGPEERKRIIMGFARREFTVLVSVALLTFGFDLAAAAGMDVTVESMSDLCPRKSLPMQMQVWGRVLRMKDQAAIIMDHVANWQNHGFPDDPRAWSLDGKAKRAGAEERAEPARQCPIDDDGCGFVHRPAPCCPNCGRVYPIASRIIDEVEGDLAEIDRAAMVKERKQTQGRAETLEDLIVLGEKLGRKPGWARHVFAARQAKKVAA
jgi:superfamily II DNA or RNA helicase